MALGSADAPRQRLAECGWLLRNPLEVTRDPRTFQRYLQQSKAEFSVAKHGYVVSRCGWILIMASASGGGGVPI
jgi:hypothetical protein